MLGRELSEVLAADGSTGVVLADRARLEVTDADAVRQALSALGPSGVVLNAAGWTIVDAAEAHENEARAVNRTAGATSSLPSWVLPPLMKAST